MKLNFFQVICDCQQ